MSRLFYTAKNYMKLILRARAMLIIIIVGMLLVVATLASAFHTLLDNADGSETFSVGYEMSDDSRYKRVETLLTQAMKEQGIEVDRFEGEDPEELIRDGEVDVMVVFDRDGYRLIGDKSEGINVRTVQYMIYNADRFMDGKTGRIALKSEDLDYTEISGAENYYGIIEIVYFLTVGSTIVSMLYMTERKNNIGMRFKTAGSGMMSYWGKLFAGVMSSWIVQVFLATGLVVLLFDVTIGKPVISIGLLMLTTVAYFALGMFFFGLFGNVATAIGVLYAVLWFAGYLGGSFETYMYSPFPESVKRLSPSYYINRSLVELSVSGESDYLIPCVFVMIGISVVFIFLGALITSKKKEV